MSEEGHAVGGERSPPRPAMARRELANPGLLRVLIVDDDFLFSDYLPRELRREVVAPQLDIMTERTALAAMRRLREERYDVVVADYDLRTDETGVDVLRIATDAEGRPLRILLTGHSPQEIGEIANRWDVFLDKPATLREVVPLLAQVIGAQLGVVVTLRETQ